MNNKGILISVITPFYNSSNCMENPINAMYSQTYSNWEWICIDDCSTDDTLCRLKNLAKNDSRIKVIARKINGGNAATAINEGMEYCKGKYVQLLGHDDSFSTDLLEQLAKRIGETNADIVIPDAIIVHKNISQELPNHKMVGIMDSNDKEKYQNREIILTGREAVAYSIGWLIHAWACFSINLIKKCGKQEENGMNGDEYHSRVLFLNADKVAFSRGAYIYLRRQESISNKLNVKSFDVFFIEKKLLHLLKSNHFDKSVIDRAKRELAKRYIYFYERYLLNYNKFSPEERAQISEILSVGRNLAIKESFKYVIKDLYRLYKYTFYYKIWEKLSKKLRKKGYIE